MMTKREINFFSETLSSGNFTEFLNLFIPGLYDKGTIVTDVLDPNLRKIDTWAKTVDEQFNKICGQNIEGFIEDVGTKKENNFYLSKNKNGLYLCNGETSSTDPDDTVAFTKMDINTIYELITSLQTSNDKKLDKGTVPASLNSAEKIVAALQGNGGLKFDENLLYLNDEGTKKVGYYYLDRLADGIFECLEQTEETVNNSAKFRDISNKASADRLDNLRRCQVDYIVESKTYTKGTVFNTDEILDNDIFIISVGLNSTERAYTAIHSIRKNIDTNNLVLSFFGSGNINSPATVV